MPDAADRRRFVLFLIKPSHYDDDGYVIQWMRSALPSNSLACLNGIARNAMESGALGEDVDMEIVVIDETNARVRPDRIARQIKEAGGLGLVGFVGVQSNQYPRVMDCARPLRAAGVPVCIGGFHVSGCLAMLPDLPESLREALDLGVSLFAGEAEGRFVDVLRDAAAGTLKPIYNHLDDLPGLEGAAHPFMAKDSVSRTIGAIASFDAGRGCPFLCSFCTIINVQGRKSRYRSADDIEAIIRSNHAGGMRHFFITDDNLARNRNWEQIFDRLIALRQEGLESRFVIQVDTACHKIPRFIEKAAAAGVRRVFIGLENIDPDNLAAAKKKQNHIDDYREMLLAWRSHRCITYCGYIIGLPNDTKASVLKRIEVIQRELPLDLLQFSCLTPLPGCEDHKKAVAAGVDIDPDLNKFDLEHVVTDHPRMSRTEWQETYHAAFAAYYTDAHMKTVIRRAAAGGPRVDTIMYLMVTFWAASTLYNIYPLEAGLFRRRVRRDRRPGFPIEHPLVFYPRETAVFAWRHAKIAAKLAKMWLFMRSVLADPNAKNYTDEALRTSNDYDHQEMFELSEAAKGVAAKAKHIEERKHADEVRHAHEAQAHDEAPVRAEAAE